MDNYNNPIGNYFYNGLIDINDLMILITKLKINLLQLLIIIIIITLIMKIMNLYNI